MAYEHAMRATRKGGRPAERSGDSREAGGRLVRRVISAALLFAIGGVVFFTLALLRQFYVERSFNVR